MNLAPFAALPDEARLWLLALEQPAEIEALALQMDPLIARWRHKGVQYQGAWALLEPRLLAVAEPTMASAPSGCAIDGMLRGVARIVADLGLALVDPQAVLVRLPEGIRSFTRAELPERLAEGTLDDQSPVVDLALLSLGDLRAGRLERPLAATWIGRKYLKVIPLPA
jgi:hypothetical protein